MGTTKATEPKAVVQMAPEATEPKTLVQMEPDEQIPEVHKDVRVFISHKHQDKDAALRVAQILQNFSGRLKIFVSEKDIKAGDNWDEELEEKLRQSDVLLLLYTDPTQEWDWCLYEAGMFRGQKPRRVICLFPPGADKPKPLRKLQAVAADEKTLKEFLRSFICTEELTGIRPPLNNKAGEESIELAAKQIEGMFVPREARPEYTARRMCLEIPLDTNVDSEQVPGGAQVEADAKTLAIFGKAEGQWTWAELVESLAQKTSGPPSTKWLDELGNAMLIASKGDLIKPMLGTFLGAEGGKFFRPILFRVDRAIANKRVYRFYVIFNEELAPEEIGGPRDAGVIFNLLRIANRFRWELIEPFLEKGDKITSEEQAAIACKQLQEGIENIEEESRAQGFLDPEKVKDAFDSDSDKVLIGEQFDSWNRQIRQPLMQALARREMGRVKELIEAARKLNQKFTIITAKRYSELANQL